MGNDSSKVNENIYFKCRKEAAKYDHRLSSRESAAELLGVSLSSLADYELGNTKVVPVDKVNLMADLYNAPELRTRYCKIECPLGKDLPLATEIHTIEAITVKLLSCLECGKTEEVKQQLINLAAYGIANEAEVTQLDGIKVYLEKIIKEANELSLLCEKIKQIREFVV